MINLSRGYKYLKNDDKVYQLFNIKINLPLDSLKKTNMIE